MSKAMGMIEVTGYVAAVEAADSALKAANVTLIGLEKVNAGITTVKIIGDVGAVKAAVDAASASADSLGLLRTSHVIPRVDEQVERFFFRNNTEVKNKDMEVTEVVTKNVIVEQVSEDKNQEVIKEKEAEPMEKEDETMEETEIEVVKDEAYYNSMKVEELRRYVRNLHIPAMTNKQIKFAKKDVLVKAILDYNKAGEK